LKEATVELQLAPLDNERLLNLCGALDQNIRQIETAFDISIARRGERFSLHGDAKQAARAARLLEKFYASAAGILTVDDIQLGLVEYQRSTAKEAAAGARGTSRKDLRLADGQQMPALLTKKPDLHGRTPRQREYLQNIFEHDVTFGVGPAGTGKTYLAVACAVDALERDAVKRCVLVRPAVEAGERLGFLPGDLVQ